MPAYNRVIIAGNLGGDPELRYTPSGTAVCDVSVAINEKSKDASGEYVDSLTWVSCTLWQRTAEIAAEYCRKGSAVLIEGRLKQDSWTDKASGQQRQKLKVVGSRLVLLGRRDEEGPPRSETPPASAPSETEQPAPVASEPADDDIPF